LIPAEQTTDETERQPSRTYRLDIGKGRVRGHVDGIEAVKQFVVKQLLTDRFRHEIYSINIGQEIRVGGEYSADVESMISEALLIDDRVIAIKDFQSTINGDKITVAFTVVSIFGDALIQEAI